MDTNSNITETIEIYNANEDDPKLRTISELKAAEARKPKALTSLKEKLTNLASGLGEEEKAILGQLLGQKNIEVKESQKAEEVVFSKPQQSHLPDDGLDKVVFSKPQQSHLPDDGLSQIFGNPQ